MESPEEIAAAEAARLTAKADALQAEKLAEASQRNYAQLERVRAPARPLPPLLHPPHNHTHHAASSPLAPRLRSRNALRRRAAPQTLAPPLTERAPLLRRCQDKLLEFWEVTKAELAEAKAALRAAAREGEEAAAAHGEELRIQVQKVKHLQYEHASAIAALALDREAALKVQADEFQRTEDALMCVVCVACALSCLCARSGALRARAVRRCIPTHFPEPLSGAGGKITLI